MDTALLSVFECLQHQHGGAITKDHAIAVEVEGTAGFFRVGLAAAPGLSIALRVTNLLDTAYADRADFAFGSYRYFPGRPRAAFLEFTWRRD